MKKKTNKRLGQQIIESLQEFVETLKSGANIQEACRCRVVELDPKSAPANSTVVEATRKMIGASQRVFAKFLGVSAQTVRAREQGEEVLSDMAKRFMDEIRLNPDYWRTRLREVVKVKKRVPFSSAH